jgi:8-oxo-dGTP pyrophosphatase MutT (NUDIX family)
VQNRKCVFLQRARVVLASASTGWKKKARKVRTGGAIVNEDLRYAGLVKHNSPLGLSFAEEQGPPPKAAATVLLLRESAGLETFAMIRNPKSGFLGGAAVFPGGKVDPADGSVAIEWTSTPRLAQLASERDEQRGLLVAALRETLEEAGVLPGAATAAQIDEARTALKQGVSFAEAALHLGPRPDELVPFARWVTPSAESRRFDARFFLLPMPEGQDAAHDGHETVAGFWSTPAALIEKFVGGEILLAPPTLRALELLTSCATISDALRVADRQSLLPICPLFVPEDPPLLVLPGDPLHQLAEPRVDGPTRFVLRDGRFLSDHLPSR